MVENVNLLRYRRASVDPTRVRPQSPRRPQRQPGDGIGLSRRCIEGMQPGGLQDLRLFTIKKKDSYDVRLDRLVQGMGKDDAALVRRAFAMMRTKYAGQIRHSGRSVMDHFISVAEIIRHKFRLRDGELIAAALLHDILEDFSCHVLPQDLVAVVGQGVTNLVMAVSKLDKEIIGKERNRKYWHNWINVMKNDPRVAILKIADNLHNMEDQKVFVEIGKPEKALQHSEEASQVYGPVARMLGMWRSFCTLMDQALPYLEEDKYARDIPVYQAFTETLGPVRQQMEEQAKIIRGQLRFARIGAEVMVVCRSAFEVLEEAWRANLTLQELLNINSFTPYRIIIIVKPGISKRTIKSPEGLKKKIFYLPAPISRALGALKDSDEIPVFASTHNYVMRPDADGYQAVEAVIPVEKKGRLVVAIMTKNMHRRNEEGILVDLRVGRRKHQYDWTPVLAQFLDQAYETFTSDAVMRQAIAEFTSFITIITPEGRKVRLHRDSTLLEFALGLTADLEEAAARGDESVLREQERAQVADRFREVALRISHGVVEQDGVSRRIELHEPVPDGATVEIETVAEVQACPQWLSIAWNERHRAIIREYLEGLPVEEQRRLGEAALDQYSAQFNTTWQAAMEISFIQDFLGYFNEKFGLDIATPEEFLRIVGQGMFDPRQLGDEYNQFYSDRIRERKRAGLFKSMKLSLKVDRDSLGLGVDVRLELAKLHINIDRSSTYRLADGGSSMHFVFAVASSLQVFQVENIMKNFLASNGGGKITKSEVQKTQDWESST